MNILNKNLILKLGQIHFSLNRIVIHFYAFCPLVRLAKHIVWVHIACFCWPLRFRLNDPFDVIPISGVTGFSYLTYILPLHTQIPYIFIHNVCPCCSIERNVQVKYLIYSSTSCLISLDPKMARPGTQQGKQYQIILFTCSCVRNISNICTKLTPLYSPSSTPSNESNSTAIAPLLAEWAYLSMLYIFQLTHTTGSVTSWRKKTA